MCAAWLRVARSCVIPLFLAANSTVTAQGADVIRGQVSGADNAALENVVVTAISMSTGTRRVSRTDRSGRYTIIFPSGEGDYMMTFAAIGYRALQFELKRTADQDILVGNSRMSRLSGALDTIDVRTGLRRRVSRDAPDTDDISGTEQVFTNEGVAANQQGDLNAMARTIPGIYPIAGPDGDYAGFSVLGLPMDQNAITLNNGAFFGSSLPRDANVSLSVLTTPYDVSRGGFSGAELNIRAWPGSNFTRRSASLLFNTPSLQLTDGIGRSLGQEYTNLSFGGIMSGPIVLDKAFYSVSYQAGRRVSDLRTLLNIDASGLRASGIASDSLQRLTASLNAAGVPTSTATGSEPNRLDDDALVFGRFDLMSPYSNSAQALNLTFNGSWDRRTQVGQSPSALPDYSGDRRAASGNVQLNHTAYIRGTILSESTIGASEQKTDSRPYLTLPGGTVIINSALEGGETGGISEANFGTGPFIGQWNRSHGLSLRNQLSWFSMDNKHRLKLTSELRQDRIRGDQGTNLRGTYSYGSLADLEANQPLGFTRSLSSLPQNAAQTQASVSLGDSYKATNSLQIQYGLRLDANHFSTVPQLNPLVGETFGVRNNVTPNRLYMSPRIGFSLGYGTAPQIVAFAGAARMPRAVIRGGIGVFQSATTTSLIQGAVTETGIRGALRQLNCIGAATPLPTWDLYLENPAAVPSVCADGTTMSAFASVAPDVTLFAKDYAAPRSVRGNLQWSGSVLSNRFNLTANATYSRNLHQPGFIDLNFNPVVRFTLPDEADRPVFVQTGSIVPSSGYNTSHDARSTQQLGRVVERVSNLEGMSRQLALSLSPMRYRDGLTWSISYVYGNNRAQANGFNNTDGNPLDVQWARSASDVHHQITYTLGYDFLHTVRVFWFGRFMSGTPFTPLASGDVNGDGYFNDRAFVFNPANVADADVAAGMHSLLATGSGAARDCLSRQLGKIAAYNSCEAPWASTANLSISLDAEKFHLPRRASLSIGVDNPSGAADYLLHGDGRLHGWGQTPFLDPTLLYVRGFDATASRYKYLVNSRFGSTSPAFQMFRSPVTVTLSLRIDLGPPQERQVLTQLLDRGRTRDGDKVPETMLYAMYAGGGIVNPMTQLLRQAERLTLTGSQADSIATINWSYSAQLDSVWTPVLKSFADLPPHYDKGAVYDRYKRAREASIDLLVAVVPRVRALLNDDQMRKLPPLISNFLDTRYLMRIRAGTIGGSPAASSSLVPLGG